MILDCLLSNGTLNKLSQGVAMYPNKAYRLVNYMDDLDNTVVGFYIKRLIDLA